MKAYFPMVKIVIASLLLSGSAFGQLQITNFTLSATGTCNLSWTHVSTNYIVQQKASLMTGDWQYVDQVVATNLNTVSNAFDSCFYRIRKVRTLNFPDANFKNVVTNAISFKYSPLNQIYDIDVEAITYLNAPYKSITNATGIEALTNLQYLYCYNNLLANLNVSACSNLQLLACTYNLLTNLNVSTCSNLQQLYCGNNLLANLNVSACTNLNYMNCSYNPFTYLFVNNTKLMNLTLAGCTNLYSLVCTYNLLANLDVSVCTNLQYLQCYNNLLTNLNVSACTNLQYLYCRNNLLTNLNVSACTNLQGLDCEGNNLKILNISSNKVLIFVYAANNPLTNIVVWWNPPGPTDWLYYSGTPTFSYSP